MKIELTQGEKGEWSIQCDNKICDRGGFDEALGVVAALLLGVRPRYMETLEGWYTRESRYGNIEPGALRLTDQRVIAGHVIQAEYQRAPIREVSREESKRYKNKTFPNL